VIGGVDAIDLDRAVAQPLGAVIVPEGDVELAVGHRVLLDCVRTSLQNGEVK
jgi:hypothetical protein